MASIGAMAARIANAALLLVAPATLNHRPSLCSSVSIGLILDGKTTWQGLKGLTKKVPGWGLVTKIIETRVNNEGIPQALICPEGHEAPFWLDLQQVAQFKGRFIYTETGPYPDQDAEQH